MRLFTTIVQQGTFHQAADLLGITATKASKDIKHLEAHLQVKLLQRTTRSIHLTDAGKIYFQSASDILESHQHMLDKLQSIKHNLQGEVRISAPALWGKIVLTPIILAFKKKHPEVSFIANYTNQRIDLNKEDVHICFRSTLLNNETYLARYIGEDNYVLSASDSYLKQSATINTPSDLDNHSIIYLAQQDRLFEKISFQYQDSTIHKHLKGSLGFNDKESIYQATKRGFGLAVLPRYLIANDLETEQLFEVLEDYPIQGSKFYALYNQRRRESAVINQFIDFVIEWASK
jgi:DNA-binding transcriptional LysR family regulator